MMSSIAIGAGAGLVSALLFAVVITGSPLAVLLSVAAPLPVLIAALGWHHRAGLVATVVGAVATALAFNIQAALSFAIGWALPAWGLGFLALLGRAGPNGAFEWYPLGRILLAVALLGGLITIVGVIAIGGGDHAAYRELARQTFEAFLRMQTQTPAGTPLPPMRGISAENIIAGIVTALPFFVASSFATILAFNVWIAAKVVAISGRLARPWPFIPATAMPRAALGLLLAGAVLAFLPGFLGVAGLALLGSLNVAFALQGLALVHDASRGRPGRPVLLVATYFMAIFISQIAWPLLAMAGITDAAIGLRRRLNSGAAGPPST
jgi:hypothetical protein